MYQFYLFILQNLEHSNNAFDEICKQTILQEVETFALTLPQFVEVVSPLKKDRNIEVSVSNCICFTKKLRSG